MHIIYFIVYYIYSKITYTNLYVHQIMNLLGRPLDVQLDLHCAFVH